MRGRSTACVCAALFASACVSIPRDAGTGEVRQAVAERASQTVEWKLEPAGADDPRIPHLLAGEFAPAQAGGPAERQQPPPAAQLARPRLPPAGTLPVLDG